MYKDIRRLVNIVCFFFIEILNVLFKKEFLGLGLVCSDVVIYYGVFKGVVFLFVFIFWIFIIGWVLNGIDWFVLVICVMIFR